MVECNSQGKPNFLKAESHYVMQTIRKFMIDFFLSLFQTSVL